VDVVEESNHSKEGQKKSGAGLGEGKNITNDWNVVKSLTE